MRCSAACWADVLLTGYRPGALAAFGLSDERLAETHPSLVHASLSAWGPDGPWGGRRGFDSIVQAATGIALIESPDGDRPGALPAQALDHATGYLLAGVMALRQRDEEGGTWRVRAHLARTAHWLLRTDALDAPAQAVADPGPWQVRGKTPYGTVVQSRPAFRIDDGPRGVRPARPSLGCRCARVGGALASSRRGDGAGSKPNGSSSRCAAISVSSVSTSRVAPSATTTPSESTTERGQSS